MRSTHLLSLLAVLLIGTIGCAGPVTMTGTARVGGTTSFGLGTFLRDLTREVQKSTGPVLFYRSQTGGAPQVTRNMRVTFMPDQDGTEFYLNCQCEATSIKVTDGSQDIPINRDDPRFWIRNTHLGGDRWITVEVYCPGDNNAPWTMAFNVQSSGPRITRW